MDSLPPATPDRPAPVVDHPAEGSEAAPSAGGTPLVRRRLLALGGTAAAAGIAGVATAAQPAAAVPATQAWLAGGNAGITTDGTNYLGPTDVAPLIFKTTPTGGKPTERLRITPIGRVGIGSGAPVARLEVRGAESITISGTNTATTTTASAVTGVCATGIGVSGQSSGNVGVTGTGGYVGVQASGGTFGVLASSGGLGVYGSGVSYGVQGHASAGTGVYGTTSDPSGNAVLGDGGQYGVHGINGSTAGVRGESGYVGVWGEATTYGVYGRATDPVNQSFGLFGEASNAAAYALYARGNARVSGTLSKSAGSFQIDHPLDPEHRWLSHSFVESPDMLNVYNGVAVLDAAGEAVVTLPAYFEALNRDFRYQLTAIGAPAPSLHVKTKVAGNQFAVAGGPAGLEVSWQVTGIRQDDYARAHPIVVESPKSAREKGTRDFVPPGSTATAFHPLPVPGRG